MIYTFLKNNPSLGDINSINLSCILFDFGFARQLIGFSDFLVSLIGTFFILHAQATL